MLGSRLSVRLTARKNGRLITKCYIPITNSTDAARKLEYRKFFLVSLTVELMLTKKFDFGSTRYIQTPDLDVVTLAYLKNSPPEYSRSPAVGGSD